MKNELAEYIAKCFESQQVKTEHHHPAGLLQYEKLSQTPKSSTINSIK